MTAAALILGFTGGGGSRRGPHGHVDPSSPGTGAHASSPVSAALSAVPPDIGQFGLFAPGIGWGANGLALSVTRNGGRTWIADRVPNLTGDITGNLFAEASPGPDDLILSFSSGSSTFDHTCPYRTTPAAGAGALAVSTDAGRTWRAERLPGCRYALGFSFVSPSTGFAISSAAHPPGPSARWALYRTRTGGRSWRRVGTAPGDPTRSEDSIDFVTLSEGWAVDDTQSGIGASGRGTLYRTTDGGRRWSPASICRATGQQALTVTCQTPVFFGQIGVVIAVAVNHRTESDRVLDYTTSDGGESWSEHVVPAGSASRRYANQQQPIPFSAPNAQDLFTFLSGALYASTDGGNQWSRIAQPQFKGFGQIDFVSPDYGWATVGNHFDYTTDAGRTWQPIGKS